MKKINEDLLKLKIDIAVESDEEFQDIAIVVDKIEFLKKLKRIRDKLGLNTLLKLDGWWWEKCANWTSKNLDKNKILEKELASLCRLLNRPYHREALIQAILFGKVVEHFQPLIIVVDKNTRFQRPYIAIFPRYNTTDAEIRNALTKVKKFMKTGSGKFTFQYMEPFSKKVKSHPIIRKKREWYWFKLAHPKIEYHELADKWNDTHPEDEARYTRDRISKGILDYEKLLKM